jgi:hypothetical protein
LRQDVLEHGLEALHDDAIGLCLRQSHRQDQRVVSWSAVEELVSELASRSQLNAIITSAPINRVGTGTREDGVAAVGPEDQVVPHVSFDRVGPLGSDENIIARL